MAKVSPILTTVPTLTCKNLRAIRSDNSSSLATSTTRTGSSGSPSKRSAMVPNKGEISSILPLPGERTSYSRPSIITPASTCPVSTMSPTFTIAIWFIICGGKPSCSVTGMTMGSTGCNLVSATKVCGKTNCPFSTKTLPISGRTLRKDSRRGIIGFHLLYSMKLATEQIACAEPPIASPIGVRDRANPPEYRHAHPELFSETTSRDRFRSSTSNAR
ncbi:hypothetical protein SDC9_185792 [bioreactor metagenome]|uniref:Uncharacterized protein n=1 Tax=bioreactor metagenome TaxID=1076179 RepID=A0A645HGV0_9ZZZZ